MITDLFAQGVYGFPAQMRAAIAKGANEMSPTPDDFLSLVRAIFYLKTFDPGAAFTQGRAGLMFTHNNESFRVLRDFANGASQLAMKNGTQLQPLAEGAQEVTARLRSDFVLPSEEIFDALLALGPADFPSYTGAASQQRSRAQVEDEIKSLRAKSGSGTKALEYELDGLQKQRFQWEDLQQQRDKIVRDQESYKTRLRSSDALDTLPENFPVLVQDAEQAKAKRQQELAAIIEPEDREIPKAPLPLAKQPSFWGALAGGMLLLILCFVLEGQWRFLGLLDIGAFGWAAIVAWLWVGDAEAHTTATQRERRHTEVRQRIEERFQQKTAAVKRATDAMQLSASEILSLLQERAPMKVQLRALDEKLQAFDAGPGESLRSHEHDRVLGRIQEIEDQLALSVQSTDDPGVRERITALEREIVQPAARGVFSLQPLLFATNELTGKECAPVLAQRAGQFLDRWWGKVSALTLDERANATAANAPLAQHPKETQDQVYLALRLAAFELAPTPWPLWADRLHTLPHLLPAWLQSYLPFVAQKAQVIVSGASFGMPNVVVIK